MCRWLAYIGEPITPNQYLYEEQFSLIEQSQAARKSKSVINGDGFGLGWYTDIPEPGLFRDVLPAWSDENLKSLASHIRSGLFMAHVRAATDTASHRANCHPFRHDSSLFMHNGQISGYPLIRRKIEALIPDEYYNHRSGTTDSEAIFLYLKSLVVTRPFHESVQQVIRSIVDIMDSVNIKGAFRFTAAYSDGDKLCAVRYSSDPLAPTLFYNQQEDNSWLVVSEPLDDQIAQWSLVPANHTMVITKGAANPMIQAL